MERDLEQTLLKGLSDELYAAQCFFNLAHMVNSPKMMRKILSYTQDEINHSKELIVKYEAISDKEINIVLPKAPEIRDILEFLIEYKAKEMSAVSYYDTLIKLLPEAKEKEIFKKIKEEEEDHLHTIDHFIDSYLHLTNKNQ